MASPIHALPVELLTAIFLHGVLSQPVPDDRDPATLTFEVAISHVSRHWRQVALHMPHLWTTIHFRTKLHQPRGHVYLSRSQRLPIDIWVDTCSDLDYKSRKNLIFRNDFLPTFGVVLPHIDRWRELHLKVADLQCKASARKVLNTCGTAPVLRTLQLWHVQNWRTPERLFTAIGPPPVVVFGGQLPSLRNIILQGVNLPWAGSPFLSNLTTIEYALHSDDVRMPFHLWRNMLAASPSLERLSLLYSGPRARSSGVLPPDGIDWWGADPPDPDDHLPPGAEPPPSTAPVLLSRLRQMQLHDLDPDYIVAVLKSLDAPNLRSLTLELDTDEQDFGPFVAYLASPPSRKHHTEHESHAQGAAAHRAAPKFPLIESLAVSALGCSVASWQTLLESAPGLTRLEADFARMPQKAFDVLFGTVRRAAEQDANTDSGAGTGAARAPEDRPTATAAQAEEAAAEEEMPIAPLLETVRFAGVTGKQLVMLAAYRRGCAREISRWEVEESARDEASEGLRAELEDRSERWRRDEEEEERRVGKVREPWRWDEPLVSLRYFREEVSEEYEEGDEIDDDDEEEEDDEQEEEEGGEEEEQPGA